MRTLFLAFLSWFAAGATGAAAPASAADDPDLIFRKTTVWKFLSPDHKLATYAIDDPEIEGVSCYFTVPEKGGWTGWLGVAEQLSDASLSCRQVGPITFKRPLEQGAEAFRQRRSLFFKKMRIVRGCDQRRNVLVYVVYTDKLIEGSPKSSTSTCRSCPGAAVNRRDAATGSRADYHLSPTPLETSAVSSAGFGGMSDGTTPHALQCPAGVLLDPFGRFDLAHCHTHVGRSAVHHRRYGDVPALLRRRHQAHGQYDHDHWLLQSFFLERPM